MDVSSLISNSQSGHGAAGRQDKMLDKPSTGKVPDVPLLRTRRGRQKRQKKTPPSQSEEGPVTYIENQPLSSKSNYQCMVEGEHARLGYYPDDLIRQVVSKRVSHSVAERSRRERLNKALQKLLEVLVAAQEDGPSSGVYCPMEGQDQDGQDQAPTRERFENMVVTTGSNTKVKTVEMAIEYINSQQKAARDMKAKLEDCQRWMGSNGGR